MELKVNKFLRIPKRFYEFGTNREFGNNNRRIQVDIKMEEDIFLNKILESSAYSTTCVKKVNQFVFYITTKCNWY